MFALSLNYRLFNSCILVLKQSANNLPRKQDRYKEINSPTHYTPFCKLTIFSSRRKTASSSQSQHLSHDDTAYHSYLLNETLSAHSVEILLLDLHVNYKDLFNLFLTPWMLQIIKRNVVCILETAKYVIRTKLKFPST